MMDPLLNQHIARHVSLSDDDRNRFAAAFVPKVVKKKSFLLQEGEVNTGVAFVTEGILRSYAIDRNGFEHVLQFAPAGWWMADMESFTRQKPAGFFIDALENTQVLWLAKSALDKLFHEIPVLERLFRILAENSVIAYQNRLISNLSLPARLRYERFCQSYPSLIQRLPQKQVASYIGVTPEFLSKMLHEKRPAD